MLSSQEALSKHFGLIFLTLELSHSPPWLDQHSLHCEMIIKLFDRGRFSFEICHAKGNA